MIKHLKRRLANFEGEDMGSLHRQDCQGHMHPMGTMVRSLAVRQTSTLILNNLQPQLTVKRAPGPGAITKVDFEATRCEALGRAASRLSHRQRSELQAQGAGRCP